MTHYDVLIVGCGPVGATLANQLRQKGHSVAIFDRDMEVFHCPRAMMLDPESCRIYQEMGIMNRLAEKDARPAMRHLLVNAKRKPLMELNFEGLEGAFGYQGMGMMFHQPALERMLRDDFTSNSNPDGYVDAYYGYEVIEVASETEKATLKARNVDTGEISEFSGQFLIGSDGGASFCRKYLGAKRVDLNYSRRWIVMDVIVHDKDLWNSIPAQSEFMCRPDSAVVYVKGFHGHIRFDFEVTDEIAKTFGEDDARKLIANYFDPSSIEFQRIAPYHFYAGMPEHWRKGRVLLAGDAAHQTSPFQGQGLNMGIRDTVNLAFKLDLIFKGLAGDAILDTYEEERWENCEFVIQRASAGGITLSTSSKRQQLKRNLAFFIARSFPKRTMQKVNKGGHLVPYRNGFIGAHDLSGHRMIQPHVTTADGERLLLDDVIGSGFVLLKADGNDSEASEDAIWFEDVLGGKIFTIGQDLNDVDGKLADFFTAHNIQSVLMRPDRYIFSAGEDANKLISALRHSLSEYAPSKSA